MTNRFVMLAVVAVLLFYLSALLGIAGSPVVGNGHW